MIYDKAYCLNLLSDLERKELSQVEFEKIGIEVEFIESIDGTKLETNEFGLLGRQQGLNQTIIKVINNAINNGFKAIRILKDNVVFDDNHNEIFEENKGFIPDDCSLLYRGCINEYSAPMIKGRIHKVRKAGVWHDLTMTHKMFELVKVELKKMRLPSDLCIAKVYRENLDKNKNHLFKAYCFKRGISSQRAGYSDNVKRRTNIEVD